MNSENRTLQNVLLINANPYTQSYASSYGLEIISSYAKKEHGDWCNIEILNPFHESFNPYKLIKDKLKSFRPMLIGISIRNYNECIPVLNTNGSFDINTNEFLGKIKKITDIIKKTAGNVPVIAGGAAFTCYPERMLDVLKLDIGLVGPGEYSFSKIIELLKHGELQRDELLKLPGIVCRDIDGFIYGEAIYSLENERYFDVIKDKQFEFQQSFPKYNYSFYNTYAFPVRTHQGCGMGCVYCMESRNKNISYRPVKNIIRELEYLIENYNCQRVFFTNAEMNMPNPEFVNELCSELIRTGLNKKIKWSSFFNVTPFSLETAKLIKESGCERLDMAIDNFHDKILKNLKRNFCHDDIVKLLEISEEAGLSIQSNIFFGAPGEDKEIVDYNIAQMKAYIERGHLLTCICGLRVYPGTPLHEYVKQNSYKNIYPADIAKDGYSTGIFCENYSPIELLNYLKEELAEHIDISQFIMSDETKRENLYVNRMMMAFAGGQIDRAQRLLHSLKKMNAANERYSYFAAEYYLRQGNIAECKRNIGKVLSYYKSNSTTQPIDFVIYRQAVKMEKQIQ